ncbi:uncharacterized protein Dvir_GJ26545, isoform B [Drosophila virilis]|uniref:Uncharacterized protein, isoform B n=1 Tax=Drosophila virilis TaxID=7244 RepID=A0A0Q9WKF1_DROVI|nr:uncharacterized protein LOC26531315 [Drosophila virilis]XP_032290052.1 uncharacterized protein LOC26531315 [Drosophila virilis]KRF85091.1 uncharacterized protein Dvir_GJ26545, isoform B [Drosophila virilis]
MARNGPWTDHKLLLVVVDNLNATFRYKISVTAAHKSSGKITRGWPQSRRKQGALLETKNEKTKSSRAGREPGTGNPWKLEMVMQLQHDRQSAERGAQQRKWDVGQTLYKREVLFKCVPSSKTNGAKGCW